MLSVMYISRAFKNSARLSPKVSYMLCRPTFMTRINSSVEVAAKPCWEKRRIAFRRAFFWSNSFGRATRLFARRAFSFWLGDGPSVVHILGDCLNTDKRRTDIDCHHAVEVLETVGIDWPMVKDAGVAHKDVNCAKGLGCFGHSGAEFFGRGTVGF